MSPPFVNENRQGERTSTAAKGSAGQPHWPEQTTALLGAPLVWGALFGGDFRGESQAVARGVLSRQCSPVLER